MEPNRKNIKVSKNKFTKIEEPLALIDEDMFESEKELDDVFSSKQVIQNTVDKTIEVTVISNNGSDGVEANEIDLNKIQIKDLNQTFISKNTKTSKNTKLSSSSKGKNSKKDTMFTGKKPKTEKDILELINPFAVEKTKEKRVIFKNTNNHYENNNTSNLKLVLLL